MPIDNTLGQAAELLEKIKKLTAELRRRLENFNRAGKKCDQEQDGSSKEHITG